MAGEGRKSREDRLTTEKSGAWASSSTDFVVLVRHLYCHSRDYAESVDGNYSPYALCAIPMLFSALRCLMIEYESFPPPDRAVLEVLTKPNDFANMLNRYKVTGQLLREAELLNGIRNEIAHPAHRPTGTPDNWPGYLREIKKMGLLQSTGGSEADYVLIAQMSSHNLLAWACRVTRDIAACILRSNSQKAETLAGFLDSYHKIGFENDL